MRCDWLLVGLGECRDFLAADFHGFRVDSFGMGFLFLN